MRVPLGSIVRVVCKHQRVKIDSHCSIIVDEFTVVKKYTDTEGIDVVHDNSANWDEFFFFSKI